MRLSDGEPTLLDISLESCDGGELRSSVLEDLFLVRSRGDSEATAEGDVFYLNTHVALTRISTLCILSHTSPPPLSSLLNFPKQSQISQFSTMLTQEYGTASNIKSRVNRLSVLAAITSTQQRLKLYNRGECGLMRAGGPGVVRGAHEVNRNTEEGSSPYVEV